MMNDMAATTTTTRRRVSLAATVAGVVLLAACGGSGDDATAAPAPTTVPATTSTLAPATTTTSTTVPVTTTTTTVPATTTTTTTTTSTTTLPPIETLPPTTLVAAPPPTPIAPPADPNADEPILAVGSIAIPKLGVDMTMYEGIRLTTLDHGPGHWPGSAMPGQAGNVVVGGHRVSNHRVFRDVDQLVGGDEIIFRDEAGEHVYVVDRVEVVQPDAVWIVDPTETPTATLFACHPPGSTSQRIVVFADLATG